MIRNYTLESYTPRNDIMDLYKYYQFCSFTPLITTLHLLNQSNVETISNVLEVVLYDNSVIEGIKKDFGSIQNVMNGFPVNGPEFTNFPNMDVEEKAQEIKCSFHDAFIVFKNEVESAIHKKTWIDFGKQQANLNSFQASKDLASFIKYDDYAKQLVSDGKAEAPEVFALPDDSKNPKSFDHEILAFQTVLNDRFEKFGDITTPLIYALQSSTLQFKLYIIEKILNDSEFLERLKQDQSVLSSLVNHRVSITKGRFYAYANFAVTKTDGMSNLEIAKFWAEFSKTKIEEAMKPFFDYENWFSQQSGNMTLINNRLFKRG